MQRFRKNLFVAAGVAACVIASAFALYGPLRHSATAHASSAPELLAVLPAGAPTLVYLDIATLRASSFYQRRPAKGPIAIPNKDYADFVSSTGFDFEKDLDRVVVASWPTPAGQEERKSVVIAEGRFDRGKIRDYATRKGKVDRQQGHEVYLFTSNDPIAAGHTGNDRTGGGRMGTESITFLDDHRIALVAGSSIAPLFAAPADKSAADPARDRAARLDGAAAFMITPVPPIPDRPAVGTRPGAPAAQLLSMARSVKWITLAARPEGDNLRVSLEGECDTSTDALQLKSTMEVMRMFGSAGLQNPKITQSMNPASLAILQTLLSSAEVTQSAERVRILLELTPDVFKLSENQKPH
jgi:hypothetical protein